MADLRRYSDGDRYGRRFAPGEDRLRPDEGGYYVLYDDAQRAIAAAVAEERKACRDAQCPMCARGLDVNEDMQHRCPTYSTLHHCKAAAIRARGES